MAATGKGGKGPGMHFASMTRAAENMTWWKETVVIYGKKKTCKVIASETKCCALAF